jgi:hypothetical protein
VTEIDLRHSLIPDELIEDLLHSMPKHTGPDMEADRQLPKYDYISFMERMVGNEKQEASGPVNHMGKENKPLQANGAKHMG